MRLVLGEQSPLNRGLFLVYIQIKQYLCSMKPTRYRVNDYGHLIAVAEYVDGKWVDIIPTTPELTPEEKEEIERNVSVEKHNFTTGI